ncbi:DUF1540 domain-containing protein [Paenibacillus sp. GCM10012306]|uniref:DUF1540 domain-containing protein n=1 Tax=Paenibacillus sp. GCM10012306 TaxID=3317342 RepID=UPI0036105EA8
MNWIAECSLGHNEAEVMMMPSNQKPFVKCSVSNCHYWGESNICRAEEIIIEIDKHSGSHFKEEFAEELIHGDHKDHANTSSATCCLTFKPNS